MRRDIKDTFNKIDIWIKENPVEAHRIKNAHWGTTDDYWSIDDTRDALYWYDEVKNNKQLMFGEKKISLDSLSISTVDEFKRLVGGDFDDDENWDKLDKGIRYDCIKYFNYLYYTLNWTKSDFEDNLYNSLTSNEEIVDLFPPKFKPNIKTKDTPEDSNENNNIWDKFSFSDKKQKSTPEEIKDDGYIILRYPENMREQLNNDERFEYIDDSLIDGCPVYKLKIPDGYEVLNSVKEHF